MRLSKSRFLRVFFGLLLTLAMPRVTAHSQAFGAGESVLFNFNALGTGATGSYPHSPPIRDASGDLYGTTANGGAHGVGTVWELSLPATSGGTWTQSILSKMSNGPGRQAGPFLEGLLRLKTINCARRWPRCGHETPRPRIADTKSL
jgi:uncharacterized repeat protein (TIGR03803 family)